MRAFVVDFINRVPGRHLDLSDFGPGLVHRLLGDLDASVIRPAESLRSALVCEHRAVDEGQVVRRIGLLARGADESWRAFCDGDAGVLHVIELRVGFHLLAPDPATVLAAVHAFVAERVAAPGYADALGLRGARRSLLLRGAGTADLLVLLRTERFDDALTIVQDLRERPLAEFADWLDGRSAAPVMVGHIRGQRASRSHGHLFLSASATPGYQPGAASTHPRDDRARMTLSFGTYPGHEREVAAVLGLGTGSPLLLSGRTTVSFHDVPIDEGLAAIDHEVELDRGGGGRSPILWSNTSVGLPLHDGAAPALALAPEARPDHQAIRASRILSRAAHLREGALPDGAERGQLDRVLRHLRQLLGDVLRQQCYLDLAPALEALLDDLERGEADLPEDPRKRQETQRQHRDDLERLGHLLARTIQSRALGDRAASPVYAPFVAEAGVAKFLGALAWVGSIAAERIAERVGTRRGLLLLVTMSQTTHVQRFLQSVLVVSLDEETLGRPSRGACKLLHDLGHYHNVFLHHPAGTGMLWEAFLDALARFLALRAKAVCQQAARGDAEAVRQLAVAGVGPGEGALLNALVSPARFEETVRIVRSSVVDRVAQAAGLNKPDTGGDWLTTALHRFTWSVQNARWPDPSANPDGRAALLRKLVSRDFLAVEVVRLTDEFVEVLCDLQAAMLVGADVWRAFATEQARAGGARLGAQMRFVAGLLADEPLPDPLTLEDADLHRHRVVFAALERWCVSLRLWETDAACPEIAALLRPSFDAGAVTSDEAEWRFAESAWSRLVAHWAAPS